jgi:MFS family permease
MAWWHTRPRVLLYAAVAMLIAFFGVTLQPVQLLGGAAAVTGWDQILMIAFQIPLGLTMGMIYAGSLYFGMVLSEGSTEHGGYHEALIGLGQVCGPAAALTAEHFWPGDIRAAVFAVAVVLVVCLVAATYVTIRELWRR